MSENLTVVGLIGVRPLGIVGAFVVRRLGPVLKLAIQLIYVAVQLLNHWVIPANL